MATSDGVTLSRESLRDWLSAERRIAWLFVTPAVLLLLGVAIYPFLLMIYNSLFDYNRAGHRVEFIGSGNYLTVLGDGRFLNAVQFTLIFVVVVVVVELLLGLAIALLIYSKYIERRQWLVVLSIPPMTLSPVVSGLTWRMLFNAQFGMVNYLFGLKIDWIASRPWAGIAVMIADIWMWTPLFVLVFTATLQSIPRVYYEASRIDGMNRWQRFKWVTLPQMRTALVIVLLLRVVRAFKVFPKVQVMTLGGPGIYTETIAMITYNYGFLFFDLGRASAAGVIYWLIMFIAAFLIFKTVAEDLITPEGEH